MALPRISVTDIDSYSGFAAPDIATSNHAENQMNPRNPDDFWKIFRWLHDRKGVRHIVKITVLDDVGTPHSDEVIERTFRDDTNKDATVKIDVDVWDWRKIDICSQTIVGAAPDVKEVYLYCSGNNAVLRGWADTQGLIQLKQVQNLMSSSIFSEVYSADYRARSASKSSSRN